MSLPASERRALNQIEKTLAGDDPGLGPLFAIFTRLTGHEAMPVTERVTARSLRWPRPRPPRRQPRMWPTVLAVIGLAMATGTLLGLSLTLARAPMCPRTVPRVAAYTQPVLPGHLAACAISTPSPAK
jgi:hypothetical protein